MTIHFFSLLMIASMAAPISDTSEPLVIESFSTDEHLNWRIVNDGVMGGLSTSSVNYTEGGTAIFAGEVSLDNNGGFASTRATLSATPDGISAFRIRVKGDGNRYSFRARTNGNFDGPAYVIQFDTKDGEWIELDLPLKDFTAQFRGYRIPDSDPLVSDNIQQIAFLIADKQEGAFRLEVDWIQGVH